MAITMQGSWTVSVKSKSAAFNQRFVISGATSGNGVHAGYSCADALHPFQKLPARAFKYLLSRSGRDEPHRALK